MTLKKEVILLFMTFLLCGLNEAFSKDGTNENENNVLKHHSSLKIDSHGIYKTEECKDRKSKKWCQKQKRKNKCEQEKIYNDCKKTCNNCAPPCFDKWPKNKCTKQVNNNNCNQENVRKNCQKSCNACNGCDTEWKCNGHGFCLPD